MTEENIVEQEDIETPAPAENIDQNEDDLEPEVVADPPQNETAEEKDARIAALTERNNKLYARLQREKNKGKPASPQAPAKKAEPAQPASLTRDEAIAFAKGLSEEEVEQAKKVAVLEDCTLIQALDKNLFKDWKATRDKEVKAQQAQLPASRGSKSTVKKSFATAGLSDEEHKELFKEKIGK
jgi:hypothetical protein